MDDVALKLSMYKNWQQLPVNPAEAKLNLLLMGGCTTKPRKGSSGFWRYSVASKELGVLRMTHSSFWMISKRVQQQTARESGPHPSGAAGAAAVIVSGATTNSGGTSSTATVTTSSAKKKADSSTQTAKGAELGASVKKEVVVLSRRVKEDLGEKENAQKTAIPICTTSDSGQASSTCTAAVSSTSRPTAKELLKGALANRDPTTRKPKWKLVCNGGYSTDEGYTYVRGRGRGRYVCAECGIRCRKPSMLKKHIRSHQNLRPYTCDQCMFSFKTKGNLTKHLKSKAHSRRLEKINGEFKHQSGEICGENGNQSDSDDDRLEIDSTAGSEAETETGLSDFDDDEMSSGDETDEFDMEWKNCHRLKKLHNKFLPHRSVHTPPPTLSALALKLGEYRECASAPPSTNPEYLIDLQASLLFRMNLSTPDLPVTPKKEATRDEASRKILTNLNLPVTVANFSEENAVGVAQATASGAEISPFLKSTEDRPICELCGKEFRKIGDLRLHMNVHYYEQSNRRYVYMCPVCKTSLRSKALLQKHMSTVHPNASAAEYSSALTGESSSVEISPQKESFINYLTFLC